MTNQPGLKMLLEKLKQTLENFQQMLTTEPAGQQHPLHQGQKASSANTTALPLEIGNELLITEDIVKLNSGLSNALGRVVIIDDIPTTGVKVIKASAFGIQVDVDFNMAQHMRQAYISREQTWSST